MFSAGARDTGRISLLKGIVANQMGRHLPRQAKDGDTVHQRICQPRHGVGRAGARRHQDNTEFSGRPGITLSHMHGAAFLAHQDMPQPVLFEYGVIDGEHRPPGISENSINAGIQQALNYNVRSRELTSCHRSIPSFSHQNDPTLQDPLQSLPF
jgi:hypothetical protein